MKKLWQFIEEPPQDDVKQLAESIPIHPVIAKLLIQRGITTYETAKNFFRPDLDQLHDPFLMCDMEKAVNRIESAIAQNEKVLVYGDYDVDGTTAVSVFYDFFRQLGADFYYYIPDRYREGYGLSREGIDYAIEKGISLIITLDCGIRANDLIAIAKEHNIDIIVCDHHQPGEKLPPAIAVLDPKRKDCNYPFKELTGCGVGFKLLQAYCLKNKIELMNLYKYLDLVCISIAADIVPITGENRILAHYGLRILNKKPRIGIKALMEVSGLDHVDTMGIVFGIAPRINAAGRIDHATGSVKLMLAESEKVASSMAQRLNELNKERKDYDETTTTEALEMIDNDLQLQQAKSTVLFKEDWHKGVVGIVASRCIEKYHRPTIILTQSDNKATGSARSVPGFDIYDAITKCADLLEQYGGHTHAAGITLRPDSVESFRRKFEEVVSNSITDLQLTPKVIIDTEINLNQITSRFYRILIQMAPFGPGNMQPVFLTRGVSFHPNFRVLKDKHVKLFVKQDSTNTSFEAIGFNLADQFTKLDQRKKHDIAYTVEVSEFQNQRVLQLNLKDIKETKPPNGVDSR